METIKRLDPNHEWETDNRIVAKECPRCDYDRAILTYSDYASAGNIKCNNPNCRAIIEEI